VSLERTPGGGLSVYRPRADLRRIRDPEGIRYLGIMTRRLGSLAGIERFSSAPANLNCGWVGSGEPGVDTAPTAWRIWVA